jgi:IPT/TIG domain
VRANASTRVWVRTAACISALLALGAIAAASAGAVTITSWVGGKGATPDIVTAGGGACPPTMTTINGTGFVSDGGVTSVSIGGVPASEVIVGSDIVMYARLGVGATSGSLVVTTKAGSATATMKANVVPCQSTGTAAVKPTIDSVTPQRAKGGKKLTLHGSGFVGTTSVKVGVLNGSYAIPSDGLMYVTVPAATKAGLVTIVVTNDKGTAKVVFQKTG